MDPIAIGLLCLILGFGIGFYFSPNLMRDTFSGIFSVSAEKALLKVAKDQQKEEKRKAEQKANNEETVLKTSLKDFKDTTDTSLKEIKEALTKAKTTWDENSKSLSEEVSGLSRSHIQWAAALSNTSIQGSFGEESLKSLLKDVGFVEGVNFKVQQTATDEEGSVRPDYIVETSDGGKIIIDSKVPIRHFQDAVKEQDQDRKKQLMEKHAETVLSHARDLGAKEYPDYFQGSPDFTIMYLHNVALFIAAIEEKPDLVEQAMKMKVIICPPSLVYATLKTVMLAMKERDIEKNAEKIIDTATDLHRRLKTFLDHLQKVGSGLSTAVRAFNSARGSWESRLMPKAREFEKLNKIVGEDGLRELNMLEGMPVLNEEPEDNSNEEGN